MVSASRPKTRRAHRAPRRLSRARQRGAAVFVVLMVVTMLAAIGIFATRSAGLTVTSAGYTRQGMQNHYVNELGMHAAITELGTSHVTPWLELMKADGGADAEVCAYANANFGRDAGATCIKLTNGDVQSLVQGYYTGRALFDQPRGDGGSMVAPGSLGPGGGTTGIQPLEGVFTVEVTDLVQQPTPVVGQQLNASPQSGTKSLNYYSVTITGHGQVRPTLGTNTCSDVGTQQTALLAGNETARAVVTIGPAP